jgi:hypothetical protein
MKYITDPLITYFMFFAFFGLFMFGIPLGFAFIVWDWDIVTIQCGLTILRINAVIAAIVTIIYYIDLGTKVK